MDRKFFEDEIIKTWVDDDEAEELVNHRFIRLNQLNLNVYDFVLTYYNYFIARRDYGYGHRLTMIEAHVLTDIVDNPGIWISQLAEKWGRTRSALSQTVKKLIAWGYVERVNSDEDSKYFFLYPTDKAKEFAIIHKRYDNVDTVKLYKRLLRKFSPEDLITFNKVLADFICLVNEAEHEKA